MQLLIAVVLLAWATQTLLHQWGFGAEVTPQGPAEKFVPGSSRLAAGATLELRGEATIFGGEIKLKQVCRWSDRDAQAFAPVADLIVARVTSRAAFRGITIDEIKRTLHDAGVNLANVRFSGPTSCTVTRSDAEYDEGAALRQWAEARERKDDTETRRPGDAEKNQSKPLAGPESLEVSASPRPRVSASTAPSDARTLRAILMDDLSIRLGIAKEELQISFNPKDESLLNLSEPLFKFNLSPRQVRNLGQVSWEVTVVTGASSSQKGLVTATARAWQTQAVLAKPLAFHQVIRPNDLLERRVLSDRLPDEPLLTVDQIVGQEAARDLKVGTVVSARMIDAVPLVKPGQTVTITLTQGAVRVKTVGRALEAGSYGQTVKVRNDATRDVFEVIMTAPQEGSMGPLPAAAKIAATGGSN
jgi:flagella basal body P-ring formation protein FlgA